MFCHKCGNQCPDNTRFCMRCGAELMTNAQNQYPSNNQPAAQLMTLYMNPKNSFVNYVFDVVDDRGNLVYKAETQSQGMQYGAHICDAYGRELIGIRQGSKAALVTMMFELYQNGTLFGHVSQRVEKGRYVYDLPELGFYTESDTYACNLNMSKNGYPAATAFKKKSSMTDRYTVTVNDYRDAPLVLALIMIVQLAVMRSRRRR